MDFSESQLDDIQERIGQQLETLAQHVDQWLIAKSELHADDNDQKFQAANQLLDQIEKIAREKKRSLTPRGTRKSRLSSPTQRRLDDYKGERSRKALTLRGDEGDDLRELQQWQDEINSWDLLRILSTLQYSKANPEYKSSHAQRYNKLHKYSADTHLWTKFLIMDDSAREKKLVLEWLERCARDDQADIDTVLSHFDESMGSGETSWSHGWMNTREEIKKHKRMGSLKGATPVKAVTFRAKDSSEVLVTQMDPDAPTRQGRKLEKEDEKHEHAFWVVCYDMFRRGMSWEKILGWCEERNEGWRAASLGAAQDLPRNESRLCLAGPYAGALWRRMCYKAAQEISADRYERATYGLLAGDVASVEPVCQSWTDWLYVNYNSLLLGSFEEWLKKNHPERFPSIVSQKYALYDSVPQQSDDMDIDGMSTTLRILGNEKFADKARESVYLFQGSFVAHAFDRFAANLGIAIAQVYNANETSLLKIAPAEAPGMPFYQQAAQDIDTIRLAVHAFIIYRDLGFEMRADLVDHADNIILCYINYLRELRKYEAIPTYAKCLSNDDVIAKALGRLLFDITEPSEQNQMVSLIDQAELDLVLVLTEQYHYALAELGLSPGQDGDKAIDLFPFIEQAEEIWAGWRVAKAFDDDNIRLMIEDHKVLFQKLTQDEQRLVRSLRWFFNIQSPWSAAFSALTTVMKQLLSKCILWGCSSYAPANVDEQKPAASLLLSPLRRWSRLKSFQSTSHLYISTSPSTFSPRRMMGLPMTVPQ
jgi:nuclear pore complex protein Nup107